MKRIISLSFLLCLIGCSSDKDPGPSDFLLLSADQDSSVITAKDTFHREFEIIPSTPIFFSDKVSNQLKAVCSRKEDGNGLTKVIHISKSFYDQSQPFVRELIVLHELIHCELGIGHYGHGLMSDGLPSQIEAMLNNKDCEFDNVRAIINAIEEGRVITPSNLHDQFRPTYIGMDQNEMVLIEQLYGTDDERALYNSETCMAARDSGLFPTLIGKACSVSELQELVSNSIFFVFDQQSYIWGQPFEGKFTIESRIDELLDTCSIN